MTSQEFVIWLKGFTEGVHEYNVTPKQWDLLKEKLAEVKDQAFGIAEPYRTSGYLSASYINSNTSTAITYPLNTNITYTTTTTNLDEEELNRRMDVIGQNGNSGLHYNTEEDGE